MVPELVTQCKLKNKIFIYIQIILETLNAFFSKPHVSKVGEHSSSITAQPIVTKCSPVINNINGLRLKERFFDLMDFFCSQKMSDFCYKNLIWSKLIVHPEGKVVF